MHDVQMRALLDEADCTITEIIDGNKFREVEKELCRPADNLIAIICWKTWQKILKKVLDAIS